MDFGSEHSLVSYFFTGLLATLANSDLDALTVLVGLRKQIDGQIDEELERWSAGFDDE